MKKRGEQMNSYVKKGLYALGGIIGIYLFIKYILPLAFKFLTFILGAVFSVFLWILSAAILIFAVVYLFFKIKDLKK